ncbi:MAG: hypothetical protein IJ735_00475, partial [Clostridia bacterium]|nr:hypothetical protein [Clostridia bacterium]
YTVKAVLPSGKTFTKKVAENASIDDITMAYMVNGVDAQGNSESFSFVDKVQIKIVNVGLRHDG